MKRVVITGLGALTPIGKTTTEYWHNLLKGVSGAASISTCLSVQNDLIPPTINTTIIDENIPKELNMSVGSIAHSKPVHYGLSNSFGFGGHCAAIIFKKYTEYL